MVLRKGDSLVFTATTKHTATPNPTGVERGLLFSLYAVDGSLRPDEDRNAQPLLPPDKDAVDEDAHYVTHSKPKPRCKHVPTC